MSWEQMIEQFSLEGIARSPAAFDLGKLRWLNRNHLRAMGGEEIIQHARPFLQDLSVENVDDQWLVQVMDAVKDNIETLAEISEYLPIFLPEEFSVDNEAQSVLAEDGALQAVKAMEEIVKDLEGVQEDNFPQIVAELKKRTGFKGKNLF